MVVDDGAGSIQFQALDGVGNNFHVALARFRHGGIQPDQSHRKSQDQFFANHDSLPLHEQRAMPTSSIDQSSDRWLIWGYAGDQWTGLLRRSVASWHGARTAAKLTAQRMGETHDGQRSNAGMAG